MGKLGLRANGRALCVEQNDPLFHVYADHANVDRCGEVQITAHVGGLVDVRFVDANRQFTITPDGQLETRAAGAIGEWELLTLAADKKSVSRAGRTLAIDGDLAPAVKPLHLEQRGFDFVDADGNRVVYPGVDGFDDLWFRTQGRENELDALMRQSQQIGFKVRRIWCMGDAGENQVFSLYPQNTPGYVDMLRSLVAYENGYGQIPLFTAFVDAQRVMPSAADRQRFWRDINAALVGSGAYLMSGGNQFQKNGFDPWADISDPGHGVIWSRGSNVEDQQTAPRGAPASELHATRNSFDRALMDATASPPNMRSVSGSGMVWMTEGNPFGDGGGYSEAQAWQLGRGYSILWALAVLHDRQSQRGQLQHDDTARCSAAFVKGMTQGVNQ